MATSDGWCVCSLPSRRYDLRFRRAVNRAASSKAARLLRHRRRFAAFPHFLSFCAQKELRGPPPQSSAAIAVGRGGRNGAERSFRLQGGSGVGGVSSDDGPWTVQKRKTAARLGLCGQVRKNCPRRGAGEGFQARNRPCSSSAPLAFRLIEKLASFYRQNTL